MTKEQLQKKINEQEQELSLYREHEAFEERLFTALTSIKLEAIERQAEAIEEDDEATNHKMQGVRELIDKLIFYDELSGKIVGYNLDTVDYYCWLAQKPTPRG